MTSLDVDIAINESELLEVEAGCEVLDEDDALLGDVTGFVVEGSRIKMAAGRTGAQLTFTEELDWSRQRAKPWMRVRAKTELGFRAGVPLTDQNGIPLTDENGEVLTDESPPAQFRGLAETPRTYLGVYVLSVDERSPATVQRRWQVTGYDKVELLRGDVPYTVRVGVGEPFLDAALELVRGWGPGTSTVQADSTGAALTAVTAVDYPVGGALASAGSVVADMCARINYRPPWADQNGVLRLSPIVLPVDRPTLRAYDARRLNVRPDRTYRRDTHGTPNAWLFMRTDPAQTTAIVGAGLFYVENVDYGPSSIVARGGLRVRRVVPLEAADQATFEALAYAVVAAEIKAATSVRFTTAPFPRHWLIDAITFYDPAYPDDPDFATAGRYTASEWELPLDGGDMTIVADEIPPTPPPYRPGGGRFTGGTEYDVGDWHVHEFTTAGSHTLVMVEPGVVRVHLRGTGGSGGGPPGITNYGAGGGGAGESLAMQVELTTDTAIIVGAHGGDTSGIVTDGANGGDTWFGSYKAAGGGGGGSGQTTGVDGVDGACGGGGGGSSTPGLGGVGAAGGDGGDGINASTTSRSAGGGGGVSGDGANATNTGGGAGGPGDANDYTTISVRGGGGGGGGSSTAKVAGVGVDGGGTGAIAGVGAAGADATPGVDGTGGGGGGGAGSSTAARNGRRGGLGIVVVSYLRRELVPY